MSSGNDGTDRSYRLVDQSGIVLAARVRKITGLFARTIGLLGRSRLGPGEGIWLVPCNGIHTIGMRFPIDVLVLDRELRVVGKESNVKPWRIVRRVRGGFSTIE